MTKLIYNDELVQKMFDLCPEVNYIVMEEYGHLIGFKTKPEIPFGNGWGCRIEGLKLKITDVDLNGIDWKDSLRERPKTKWVPNDHEYYYIPIVESSSYGVSTWGNSIADKDRLKNNLVCKTPDEAIKKAQKMLNAVQ